MKRVIIFTLHAILLSFIASGGLLAQGASDPYEAARTKARLEIWKAISLGTASSATAAIMDDGKIVYSEAFGMRDREKSIPVNSHTQFDIASVSKLFSSTSILLLVQEGKVELDRPVVDYIPEFTMPDPRYTKITVRMLLNHSSGMPGTYGKRANGDVKNHAYARDSVAYTAGEYLKHDPGILSVYCNDGFTFAEEIVRRISGMPYEEFLGSHVFRKLAMNDSSWCFMDGNANVVRAYDSSTGIPLPLEYVNAKGSGGLSSTAEDLCRFSKAMYSDVLFKASTLAEFKLPQYGPQTVPEGLPFDKYGLGWDSVSVDWFQKQGVTVMAKNGGAMEFSSQIHVAPEERLSCAVILSGGRADSNAINQAVMQALLEGKGILPEHVDPVTPIPATIPIPDELMPFEGYYGSKNSIASIEFDRIGNRMNIYHYGNGVFSLKYQYPYVEGGYFYEDEKKSLTLSENFGRKFLIVHTAGSDGVSIRLESLPALAPGTDGSAFDGKTWLPRNLVDSEFGANIRQSSLVAELPGYVAFSNAPYALLDSRTAVMNLPHADNLVPPRLFEREGGLWLYSSGFEYSEASLASELRPGETITIGPRGYTEWRKAASEMVFSSTMPELTRILAWSADNGIYYDSTMVGKQDFILASGSYVSFTGPPGTVFTVSGDPSGNTYDINFISAGNGTILGTTPQTIDYGASSDPVTAVPDAGYKFANWMGTGWFKTTTENPLTISDVKSDWTITANFAKIVDISGISGGGGIDVPALSGSEDGAKNFFVFNITAEKNFRLVTSGGTGECGIYLRHGFAPDMTNYYRKAAGNGTRQILDVNNPEAGDWYVYLYPASSFSNVTLSIIVNSEVPDKPVLSASISGTKVNLSWTATGTSYDIYRSLTDSTAGASLIVSDTGDLSYQESFTGTYYYYWVKAKNDQYEESDFSNTGHPGGSDVVLKILSNGVAVTNISGSAGTTKTYQIDVPAGQALLEIKAYGGTGEYGIDTCIDGSTERYRPLLDSATEPIRIENPVAGSYLIHISGKTAYSGAAIVAKFYGSAPSPVSGLVAGKGGFSDKIILTWTDSPGATFYEVWRSVANSIASAAKVGAVPDNSYEDNTDLELDVTYYYWIKSGNSKGVSKESSVASGFLMKKPLSAPTLTAANGHRFDKILLAWPKKSEAESYLIYRGTVSSPDSAILLAEIDSIGNQASYSYEDMGDELFTGIKYYYFIKAKNGSGTSGFSSGAIGMLKNSGPGSISVSKGTCFGKIRISWSEVPGATGYDVYRYTDKELKNNDGIFDAGDTLVYDDASAAKDTTYYYRINAKYEDRYTSLFSPSGSGYYSEIVNFLHAPVLKSVSKGDFSYVKIAWTAVSLAEKYKIYRNTVNVFESSALIATRSELSYDDVTAEEDTVYWYWIRAKNDTASASSVPSNSMSGFAKSASKAIVDGGTASVDGDQGSYKFYSLNVPFGATRLVVTLTGTSPVNNCDLFVKLGSYPTLSSYNARGADVSGGKTLSISNPAEGTWYVLIYGKTDYNGVMLSVRSYSASNIILSEVPGDNLVPPFTAKFKGQVVDASGKGIPGIYLKARNPITGMTSWLPAKTDAGGFWTFSANIDREGAHVFDFFFSTLPDLAKGTASHTVCTRKDSWNLSSLFDSSSYIPGLATTLTSSQTTLLQDYLNIREGWEISVLDEDTGDLWIGGTLGKTASDTALLGNLNDGLYLLFYAYDGASCGNDKLPYSVLRPCPLAVHVSPGNTDTVLDNLSSLGIVGDVQKSEILAGRIGVVSIAAFGNPDEEALGDYELSLLPREQLETLANIASNSSSILFMEDRKFGSVVAKIIKVKLDDGREFLVAADCIPVGGQDRIIKASYDRLVNSGLTVIDDAGAFKFYKGLGGDLVAEISGEQLSFKYPGFGGDMMMVPDRTTTVLGKYADVKDGYGTSVVLNMPEGCFERESANLNGINILDIPSAIYDALLAKNIQKYLDQGKTLEEATALSIIDGKEEFWMLYNYPFLEDACSRGDNIRVLSDNVYFKNASDAVGGFYKREIKAIEDGWNGNEPLMRKYGYCFDAATSTYKRIWK